MPTATHVDTDDPAVLVVQGWTAIAGCRQFFYARYADYAITMPLIILQLGIVAGADSAQIAATIGADGNCLACSRAGIFSPSPIMLRKEPLP